MRRREDQAHATRQGSQSPRGSGETFSGPAAWNILAGKASRWRSYPPTCAENKDRAPRTGGGGHRDLLELVVYRDGLFAQCAQTEDVTEFGAVIIIEVVDNGGIYCKYPSVFVFGCLSLVGNKELTRCAAIVENHNGPRLPPHSRLKVVPSDDMLHEEVQQPALLGLLQTLNLGDEFAVHK